MLHILIIFFVISHGYAQSWFPLDQGSKLRCLGRAGQPGQDKDDVLTVECFLARSMDAAVQDSSNNCI